MVNSLPQSVRLKLQQTLAQWRHWKPTPAFAPDAAEVLGQGLSNFSVKVSTHKQDWVIRIDGVAPQRLGLSRNAEWRALQSASSVQLCPKPVYQNPALGSIVCEYAAPASSLLERTAELENVASLLRNIHALPPVKFRLAPVERARRYLTVAGQTTVPDELLRACDQLSQNAPQPVLCHNDLLRANRLWTGSRLLALDWEYVALGDPLFDLAAIIEGDQMCVSDADALLTNYLQRPASKKEATRLEMQRLVYRILSELWSKAHAQLRKSESGQTQ